MGIGLVFGLLFIVVAFVGILLLVALAKVSGVAVMAGIMVLMLLLGGIALIGSAVSGIFVASVYRYATKGDGGGKFGPRCCQERSASADERISAISSAE